jgi:two-component system response regulator YesN
LCGEASDGIQACKVIKEILPDIIFTDIKMPGMDGLAMIKEIRDIVPDSKIIIITGYRDFEYARDAVKYGIFDFILKPTKIEELNAVVAKAVKDLKSSREKADELDKLQKLFQQNIPILREKLLYDIIYGINTNEDEISSKTALFGIKINKFILIVVESEIKEDDENKLDQYNKHLYQLGIINSFEEVFSDVFDVISISLDSKWSAFVVQHKESGAVTEEIIEEKCSGLQKIIQDCFDFTVTVAISTEGDHALKLPLKFKECQECLRYKLYVGNNCVIFYKDLNSFFKLMIILNWSSIKRAFWKELSRSLQVVCDSMRRINEYTMAFDLSNSTWEYLKNFYCSTISSINNIRTLVSAADDDKNNIVNRNISSLYKMVEECESVKELNSLLEEVAVKVTAKINSYNNKSMKLTLQKAVDYLGMHYNEQITLNKVAENVFVSTYYLSRMFKKELGQNFVDYLNELRMEKAKELLREGKYKTYQVAEMVGIPDAQYFSKLFKKYTGFTPKECKNDNTKRQ